MKIMILLKLKDLILSLLRIKIAETKIWMIKYENNTCIFLNSIWENLKFEKSGRHNFKKINFYRKGYVIFLKVNSKRW